MQSMSFNVLIHDHFIHHTLQLVTLQHWTVGRTELNFARTKSKNSQDISVVLLSFQDLKGGYLQVFAVLQMK